MDDVEVILIETPLPKLQRIGQHDLVSLYRIGWDDGPNLPRRSAITASRRGEGTFDNRILFLDGVPEGLVRLAAVLRPFIQQKWVAKVARLNRLPDADLADFLFGREREDLTPVRAGWSICRTDGPSSTRLRHGHPGLPLSRQRPALRR